MIMKKFFPVFLSVLLLSACAVPLQKDDANNNDAIGDDNRVEVEADSDEGTGGDIMEDVLQRGGNSFILDGSESKDDGTVKGSKSEDAGGDGTNGSAAGANPDANVGVEASVKVPRVIR